MLTGSFDIAHFNRYRVIPVAGQPTDSSAHDEMCAKLPGQAAELVNITLSISHMDASIWLAETFDGLTQILKPTDAFLALDRNTRRIDLAFQLGRTDLKLVTVSELDGCQP